MSAVNSLDNIFKILYIGLTVFSVLGIIYFAKKRRTFIVILSVVLFSIFWRMFSYYSSSRYYSFLIIYGSFLMGYGGILLSHLAINKAKRLSFFVIIAFLLLYTNTTKVFGSFNNKYLIDTREIVNYCLKKYPNCAFFLDHKESVRIGTKISKVEVVEFDEYDMHDFYVSRHLFGKEAFFINIGKRDDLKERNNYNSPVYQFASFSKDFKHQKYLSVYKHASLIPDPGINIEQFYSDAVLKAYIPEHCTYVYLVQNKLVWLIGTETGPNTEIIYHLYTDKPELLPQSRFKYKYDNHGFRHRGEEQKHIGNYLVFEKDIPSKYPITRIVVGFKADGKTVSREFNLHDDVYSGELITRPFHQDIVNPL